MHKLVVVGLNGTIIGDSSRKHLYRRIYDEISSGIQDFPSEYRAKFETSSESMPGMLEKYSSGSINDHDFRRIFNRMLVKLPEGFLCRVFGNYARECNPDAAILDYFNRLDRRDNVPVLISELYEKFVTKAIHAAGLQRPFENIRANKIKHSGGKIIGILHDASESADCIMNVQEEVSDSMRVDFGQHNTFYVGIAEDCAYAVAPGHMIIPPHINGDVKHRLVSCHKAFAPESMEELDEYLANAGKAYKIYA